MRLLISYCYSLYGSVLWDLSNSNVERICSTWRAGLCRVWGLPRTTHSMLLPFLSCQPPLSDVIAKRFIVYVQRCLSSDSEIVKCVTRYGLWFGRMASPMGCSVQYCCSKYGFTVDDMPKVSGRSIVKHYIHRADPAVIVRVRMLLELIFIRNGLFYLNMPDSDIQFLISQLCIM